MMPLCILRSTLWFDGRQIDNAIYWNAASMEFIKTECANQMANIRFQAFLKVNSKKRTIVTIYIVANQAINSSSTALSHSTAVTIKCLHFMRHCHWVCHLLVLLRSNRSSLSYCHCHCSVAVPSFHLTLNIHFVCASHTHSVIIISLMVWMIPCDWSFFLILIEPMFSSYFLIVIWLRFQVFFRDR